MENKNENIITAESSVSPQKRIEPFKILIICISVLLILGIVNLVLNITNCVRIENLASSTSTVNDNDASNTNADSTPSPKTLYLDDVVNLLNKNSGYIFTYEFYDVEDGKTSYALYATGNYDIYFLCDIDSENRNVVGLSASFISEKNERLGKNLLAHFLSGASYNLDFTAAVKNINDACKTENLDQILTFDYYNIFAHYSDSGDTLSILIHFEPYTY